jgi:hypothetical protein
MQSHFLISIRQPIALSTSFARRPFFSIEPRVLIDVQCLHTQGIMSTGLLGQLCGMSRIDVFRLLSNSGPRKARDRTRHHGILDDLVAK